MSHPTQPQQPNQQPQWGPNYGPGPYAQPPQPPAPKKKHTVRNVVLIVVAVIFIAVIASCAAGINAVNDAVQENGAATGAASPATEGGASTEQAEKPSSKTAEQDPLNVKIGQTVTYEDGLKVTVTSATVEKGGQYEEVAKDGHYVKVTVKITNGSDAPVDPTLSTIDLAYGADGTQAESAYVDGIDFGFSGDIRSGKSRSASFAYKVSKKQAKDIEITVAPGFLDYEDATFSGAAK